MRTKVLSVITICLLLFSCGDSNVLKEDKKEDKVVIETQELLKKYEFWADDNSWHQYLMLFDGKVVTYTKIQLDLRGKYVLDNQKWDYTVRHEDNGKTYVDVQVPNNQKLIYEFVHENNNYVLSGNLIYTGQSKDQPQSKTQAQPQPQTSHPQSEPQEVLDTTKFDVATKRSN